MHFYSLALIVTKSDFHLKLYIDPSVVREEDQVGDGEVRMIHAEEHVVVHGIVRIFKSTSTLYTRV